MNKRSSSSKLFFYDLHGGGAKVQVMTDERYFRTSTSSYVLIHCTVESSFVCVPVSKSSVFSFKFEYSRYNRTLVQKKISPFAKLFCHPTRISELRNLLVVHF